MVLWAEWIQKIVTLTTADRNQAHIPILIDNNPQILDRTTFLQKGGSDPLPYLVQSAKFLERNGAKDFNKPKPTPPRQLITLLKNYHFPGNIREFKSMVDDAVGMHRGKMLSMEIFKKNMAIDDQEGVSFAAFDSESDANGYFNPRTPLPPLRKVERLLVEEALSRAEGNQSIAAKLLGISQPALSKRLSKINAEES